MRRNECPDCYGSGGLYDLSLGINDECPSCAGSGYTGDEEE